MQKATISADIVKSTSLSKEEMVSLQRHLGLFIDTLEQHFHGAWGRIVRGDGVECVVPNVKNALRVALMLKCQGIWGRPEAAGFTIAAKSLLRFNDAEGPRTEYVLAGTLMSILAALVCAVAIRIFILQQPIFCS